MARHRPSYWAPLPSATQLRLLRLILAPSIEPDALDAWTASVDLPTLDEGSVRFLPALYLRLTGAGIGHPWLPIMRGWYRRTLYRNRLTTHRGLELVGLLENQGVACLLLKGCPLVALYYGDAGVRPMGDFDLLFHDATPRGRIQEIMTGPAGMRLKNRFLFSPRRIRSNRKERIRSPKRNSTVFSSSSTSATPTAKISLKSCAAQRRQASTTRSKSSTALRS